PWAVFLDSAGLGRYDILAGSPFATFVTRGSVTEIEDSDGKHVSEEDPFDLIRRRLLPFSPSSGLPFAGGAIGYFGYDLGARIHGILSEKKAPDIPDLCVGIYDWAVIIDHEKKSARLASNFRNPETKILWNGILQRLKSCSKTRRESFELQGKIETVPGESEYALAFEKIKKYIASGDCYQVNLAQQFEARFRGDPWNLYLDLRKASPSPFSVYFANPHCVVLSASPERFLKVQGGLVETCPIKGTRPRSEDPLEDKRLANELLESEKDRAENLMIVDLMRNDLGKLCENGTVKVEKLFELEHYSTVHHMVSTVSGKLSGSHDAIALLRSALPGGSITGAPKLRAMQIIEEVEPFRRGLYCGSFAHIGFDGNMDSSIAIRTMVAAHGRIRLWAGGGIVADSGLEAEYQEIRHKAQAMLRLLESPPPSC
ncbi:MAG TPA: aminodeoxychorismate synthase component I, partial [Burkholderiales bacterium]|nr:aminodeoxychorismate synthase component I [Burkholderiales bacterium]